MADWIASNTNYFPLLALSEEGDETYYPQRVVDVMENKLGFLEPWESDTCVMGEEKFKELFGFYQGQLRRILFRPFRI